MESPRLNYVIFGNLIGEYMPGTDAVREWVYLGNQRIAMLHANMAVGLNPPECGGLPSPPGGCGNMMSPPVGEGEGEQSSAPFNWVLIGLCPWPLTQLNSRRTLRLRGENGI